MIKLEKGTLKLVHKIMKVILESHFCALLDRKIELGHFYKNSRNWLETFISRSQINELELPSRNVITHQLIELLGSVADAHFIVLF